MTKQFDEQLGATMRIVRKERKISIDNVAESLGVSVPAVHYWETGQRKIYANTLSRYCAAIGVKVQYIFDRMDGAES